MKHVISVLVENRFGVLARVSGLFSGRGFNIESLNVAETFEPGISRMTIVVGGDDKILEQVTKQLNKLVDVLKVTDYTDENFVDRELALIKVNTETRPRSELLPIVEIFRANIVDVQPKSVTIEVTGGQDKIGALLELCQPFGIREIARTGRLAMGRGKDLSAGK